jgi:hypothetical protein
MFKNIKIMTEEITMGSRHQRWQGQVKWLLLLHMCLVVQVDLWNWIHTALLNIKFKNTWDYFKFSRGCHTSKIERSRWWNLICLCWIHIQWATFNIHAYLMLDLQSHWVLELSRHKFTFNIIMNPNGLSTRTVKPYDYCF